MVLVVGVVLTGGAVAFVGGTAATLQQDGPAASFEVSELNAPNVTEPNGELTVTATVTNPGEREATQVVQYRFAGARLGQELVTLEGGESTTVTFTTTVPDLSGGEYVHGVFTRDTGAVTTITVPESFTLTNATLPENTTVGEPVLVNATVTNPGTTSSTQQVEFRLNGELLDSQTIELEPGESTTVEFAVETNGIRPAEYFAAISTRDFGEFGLIQLEPSDGPGPGSAVTIANQSSDGTTVVVESVTLEEGGFVAIHDETLLEGAVAGSVIGVSTYLEPGTYENVTITLFDVPGAEFDDRELEDGDLVIAMPHFDSGDNQRYDFVRTDGHFDGPYTADGSAVIDTATVTVGPGGPPEEPPGNATDVPGEPGPPGNGTETPAEPGTETDTPTGTDNATATDTGTSTNTTTDTATDTTTDTATDTTTATDAGTETDGGTDARLPNDAPSGALQTAFLAALSLLAVPVWRS